MRERLRHKETGSSSRPIGLPEQALQTLERMVKGEDVEIEDRIRFQIRGFGSFLHLVNLGMQIVDFHNMEPHLLQGQQEKKQVRLMVLEILFPQLVPGRTEVPSQITERQERLLVQQTIVSYQKILLGIGDGIPLVDGDRNLLPPIIALARELRIRSDKTSSYEPDNKTGLKPRGFSF